MGFAFEYDPRKAASNLKKHGISFSEAMTVFDDPLAQTFPDELHSEDEARFITIGLSSRQRLLFVSNLSRTTASGSSVPAQPKTPNVKPMKNSIEALDIDSPEADPLLPRKLDLSKAVRGKYSNLLAEGTNLVILDPALLPYFPDSESVNDALHSLKQIADRTRRA